MGTPEVAICGIGAVTGYGWGRERLWEGLLSGKPAATLVGGYGVDRTESAWLARVPDGGDPGDGTSRFSRAVRAAAREAIGDAEGRGWRPGARVGVLHAVVGGDIDEWQQFLTVDRGHRRVRDFPAMMSSTPVSNIMREFGFHGPALNVSAMCASGNAGLLTAKSWLDQGIADDVVVVATDLSLSPEIVEHFVRLGVAVTDAPPLSACRPFQEGSRGFGMGEASVALVLSRRASRPYTEVLGGAVSHDAHHAVSIDPQPSRLFGCFREALADAGVEPGRVRYLNAHGPGTAQCSRAETAVLDELLPPAARVYSVKPLTGHCQGAAAAVEIAVAALGYDGGVLPAPPVLGGGHRQLLRGPVRVEGGVTVKSSLGMGGHNTVVVLAPPSSRPVDD
ncbi:beta-ketoacyl synthase N-terminal-like domain-containing protein [Rhodococcus daqingensis]|uniref:Beta-ketoacyl synthase N-terminal-like domain-containing protein n=1 Tax=Rhodococcus daqingensis TaxID=2479363 RepID=A0ABW2RSA8_9NOCA